MTTSATILGVWLHLRQTVDGPDKRMKDAAKLICLESGVNYSWLKDDFNVDRLLQLRVMNSKNLRGRQTPSTMYIVAALR